MNGLTKKIYTIAISGAFLLFAQSCSEDGKPNAEQELTQTELQTIMETDDISSVADNALAELFADNSAGKSAVSAKTNDCYVAEYSETGFVATFNNCVLNGTDNVNGTVTVTYEVGEESASFTATYVDFYVGTIKINGTRSFVMNGNMDTNSFSFTVTSDMSVEFEDESVISESGTKTFGFTFGEDLQSSTFSLAGDWTIQADGNTYAVEIVDTLEGSLSCENITSGSMIVTKNGLDIVVDFGAGECDNTATLVYPNGASEEITL
ncbi:MAG: hypothetical protein RIM83_16930 [Allomuricauda sp.]